MVLLQLDPASGGPIAYFGTFLVTTVFYTLTTFIATRYVLGATPITRAVIVGVVLAAVSLLLQQYGPAIVIAISLVVDFVAIQTVYRLQYRTAGLVAVVHYTVSAILGITLFNIVRIFSTMPG
ncbi:MAG: hypothetical protein SVG88_13310 [Halobacteriales archaeon]|nr:hypothetical protein [Halobacteriales archaeon]